MGKQILMNAIHQKMMLKEMTNRNITMNDSTHMIWMEKEQIIPSSTPGSSPRPLSLEHRRSHPVEHPAQAGRHLDGDAPLELAQVGDVGQRDADLAGRRVAVHGPGQLEGSAGRAEHRHARVVLEDGADDVGVGRDSRASARPGRF